MVLSSGWMMENMMESTNIPFASSPGQVRKLPGQWLPAAVGRGDALQDLRVQQLQVRPPSVPRPGWWGDGEVEVVDGVAMTIIVQYLHYHGNVL